MENEFIERNFLKFYIGNRQLHCHIDALHATAPKADLFTEEIVEKVLENTNCSGIISKISRTVADLNRKPNGQNDEAIIQYRRIVKSILRYLGILDMKTGTLTQPYLHLSIHGMKDVYYGPNAIEIGTFNGKSCSLKMSEWFLEKIKVRSKEVIPKIEIIFNNKFDGDESIIFHRLGDQKAYGGYGDHFHTFQIEIARTLRENYLSEIVEILSNVINDFRKMALI
ncbi:MAG TPA: hypothetical protein VJ546_03990 [Bacillales bacterium]|nr:hypothetical protein [Bacillales bacterium]